MSAAASTSAAPDTAKWHGYAMAKLFPALPPPRCAVSDEQLARPDYNAVSTRSEYVDSREVMERKAEVVLGMMRRSEHGCPFLGAGISVTAADTYHNTDRRINKAADGAGCADYASGSNSIVKRKAARLTHHFIQNVMQPTPAHRVLAALTTDGLLKPAAPGAGPSKALWRIDDVLSQNHDYLIHRAGVRYDQVNELHGSWAPGANRPIIAMSGSLDSDLFARCLESEKTADMCFSIGSSHSGLNCDRIPRSVGQRHLRGGRGQGTVILALQATTLDEFAAVRVWGTADEFMMILAEKAGILPLVDWDTNYEYRTGAPIKLPPEQRNVFIARYLVERGLPPPAGTPAVVMPELLARLKAVQAAAAPAPAPALATSAAAAPAAAAAAVPAVAAARAVAPAAAAPAQPPSRFDITVGNYHAAVAGEGADGNKHRWTAFVRVSAAGSGQVRKVVFELHPTFSPPSVEVTERVANNKGEEEFRLARLGWGTFPIKVAIHLADGRVLSATHDLSFDADETSQVRFSQ